MELRTLKYHYLAIQTLSMKYLLLITLSIGCLFSSCKKSSSSTSYMNAATIKGPNYTVPACGAAYFIVVHGIADSEAQFDTLPSGSGIDLTTATFPINVRINWHHNNDDACDFMINAMTIDAVSKVN